MVDGFSFGESQFIAEHYEFYNITSIVDILDVCAECSSPAHCICRNGEHTIIVWIIIIHISICVAPEEATHTKK